MAGRRRWLHRPGRRSNPNDISADSIDMEVMPMSPRLSNTLRYVSASRRARRRRARKPVKRVAARRKKLRRRGLRKS